MTSSAMTQVLALVFAVFAFMTGTANGVDCSTRQMCDPKSRRILFLLDASLSISQPRFDSEMVDFVINTFCGFRDNRLGARYEAGVVVFNQFIEEKIPFQEYDPDAFETAMRQKVRNKVPLRCCTTHAEAAILAKELFDARDAVEPGFENIAFFVTDGVPYVNYFSGQYGVKSSNKAKQFYTSRGLNWNDWSNFENELVYTQSDNLSDRDEQRVQYGIKTVPRAMAALKNAGVRVFFIGVPHKSPDRAVNIDYFNGKLPNLEVCYTNTDPPSGEETSCGTMEYSPLVSEPVDDHAFRVETWDLEPLITQSLDKICRPFNPPGSTQTPTPEPTPEPTPLPTGAPTTRTPTTPVPTSSSCNNIPRDVMILVDTSESMDPNRYANEMMDVVKTAAAQLDFGVGSRVGVATFGHPSRTRIRIPLTNYNSLADFNSAVDSEVKPITMKCCTNFAEAFVMAREHFQSEYINGNDKILLIVTDGTPYQNYGTDKWMWSSRRPKSSISRCDYTVQVVPDQAEKLHNDGVRVVLAGVPNIDGRSPLADFFNGALAGSECCANSDTNHACLWDRRSEWCASSFEQNKPSKCRTYDGRKVVSDGSNNVFTAENWDVDPINEGIKGMICSAGRIPTPPPTSFSPTPSPTTRNTDGDTTDGPSMDGFDFVVVLDTSTVSDAQGEKCQMSGTREPCKHQLMNFANSARKNFREKVKAGDMSLAGISSDCYQTELHFADKPWRKSDSQHLDLVRNMRKETMSGTRCLVAGLSRAERLIKDRNDQSRPVAVLLLTHEETAADLCAATSIANRIRQMNGVTMYAATVGESNGHIQEVGNLVGSTNRVYDGFDSSAFAEDIESRLG